MPIESPILQAMETLELNRAELADLAQVAITTIEYTEKGIFTSIPSDVLDILWEANPNIETHYKQFQIAKRFEWDYPKQLPPGFPHTSDIMNPHTEWRMAVVELSVNEYCAALCVPRFVIQKFEAGEQRKFPDVLSTALIMACGSTLADELMRHCREWLDGNPA